MQRRFLAAAALLTLVQATLLVSTARDKLDTKDEPYYLATAVQHWNDPGSLRNCAAPPLPEWGYALALRLADPILFDAEAVTGRHPLWSRPPEVSRRNLLAARSVTILVTLVGGLFLWLAGRRFGDAAGLLTHALWCLSPNILAHGSLATLDGWATSLLCVAAWATLRAWERPNATRALVVGCVLALAAATKIPALGFVPLALGAVALAAIRSRAGRPLLRVRGAASSVAIVALAAGLTLAALYGFHLGTIDLADPCAHGAATTSGPMVGPVPCAPWLAGLVLQWRHGQGGHWSYLFGEASGRGWWWFYLAALALKTTIGAQLLALLRLVSWIRARPSRTALAVDAALLSYPVLLIVVMSLGHTQNGLRYILPAFPFLMLFGGRAANDVRRAFGRCGLGTLVLLVALGAAEMLAVHPNHLMFFNLWAGGPKGGPRYLINGDDWGQDQRRVAAWQRRNPRGRFFYTQYTENPRHWGINFEPPPCEPRQGFYFLHAVEVHRPKRIRAGCLDWLTLEPPDARFGYSIYFYAVDRARKARLEAERGHITPFWQSGYDAQAPATDERDEPEQP